MTALIVAHFVAALIAPALGKLLGQRIFWLYALVPASACGWLLWLAPSVIAGQTYREDLTWIAELGLTFSVAIGFWQWLLGLVVSSVGMLVLFYCRSYFADAVPQVRVAGLLVAFAGTMLGLVTSDNLLALYIYWELTTVFSYLLVGHNPLRAANRGAALTALMVTTFGGLAMLAGLIGIAAVTGTTSISEVITHPALTSGGTSPAVIAACVLILLGALTKSAQVPFHFWLPGAMAAPTPVSAYLHAAAMVKAGIYLIGLLAPVVAVVPGWRPVVLVLGACTMVIGGWQALRQFDIKLLLAYGTVSQLGFLTVLCGLGTQSAALAGAGVVAAHALFKATLFLTVGIVDHSTGTRELDELSGVGRALPVVAVAAALAGASMAGFPPLAGFVAKEGALDAILLTTAVDTDGTGLGVGPAWLLVVAITLGSVLTVAYTLRFWWGAFATKPGLARTEVHPVGVGFAAAPVVLALAGLVGGFVGPQFTAWAQSWTHTVMSGHEPHGLALWHGFTTPLLLSALCWVVGIGLFVARARIAALQETFPDVVTAQEVYRLIMRGTDRLAVEVTAVVQRGSLPSYLGMILGVVVLVPGAMVLLSPRRSNEVRWFDNVGQIPVAIVIIIAALVAASARGRMKAIMMVGVTGYGVAVLFLLHGAPDLALTQVLIETVSILVLVLVLRKLPKYFTDRPLQSTRWWRLGLAILVGAVVSGAAYLSATSRIATPDGSRLHEFAYTFGYGRNIVNVTLVDTRAWDTLGEISVLVAAATGVASLIFLRARYGARSRPARHRVSIDSPTSSTSAPAVVSTTTETVRGESVRGESVRGDSVRGDSVRGESVRGPRVWLRGGEGLRPERRSVVLEMITRLLFPVMIMVSLYLLVAGHDQPGGGFAGGLVAGLAIVVRYLAGGRGELDEAAPFDAGLVMGSGLVLAGLAAIAPVLGGGKIFQSYVIDVALPLSSVQTPWGEMPVLGDIHFVTSVVFDIGVYLIVVGLMIDLVRSLGAQIDVHAETDLAPVSGSFGAGSRDTVVPQARLDRLRRASDSDEDW